VARLKDVRNFGFILIAAFVLNSFLEIVPVFPHLLVIFCGLTALFLYKRFDGDGIDFTFSGFDPGKSDDSGPEVLVEPVEAPQKLNKKVRDRPGRRELNLDKTDRDNLDFYDEAREVSINGKEKLIWGVVGYPNNPKYGELIAYIYNLSDDRIMRYKGNVQSVEGRIQPFKDYTWFTARGFNSTRKSSKSSGRNKFIIDQRDNGSDSRSSEGDN